MLAADCPAADVAGPPAAAAAAAAGSEIVCDEAAGFSRTVRLSPLAMPMLATVASPSDNCEQHAAALIVDLRQHNDWVVNSIHAICI
jgi:hypothetical protein